MVSTASGAGESPAAESEKPTISALMPPLGLEATGQMRRWPRSTITLRCTGSVPASPDPAAHADHPFLRATTADSTVGWCASGGYRMSQVDLVATYRDGIRHRAGARGRGRQGRSRCPAGSAVWLCCGVRHSAASLSKSRPVTRSRIRGDGWIRGWHHYGMTALHD